MTENVTYCDKHVSSRKCIFFVVQAACEARDAAWKKEAAELWGQACRRAKEVYEDGYFARKVHYKKRHFRDDTCLSQ